MPVLWDMGGFPKSEEKNKRKKAMTEDVLARHGAEALKRLQSNAGSGSGMMQRDNIWFDWGSSDEHIIRLVGDFKEMRSHWIGESKFQKTDDIAILRPSAFKGDSKLPMNVACGNWDADTESADPVGDNCPICRLGRNAENVLKKHGKELNETDKAIFKKIMKKCKVTSTFYFKCIDRDNPYVDEEKTRKGYKIIKMPGELFKAIMELSKTMKGVSILSDDGGIDIRIKRTKPENGKGKTTYTVNAVMDGLTVKQTPLTDEERQYRDIDLSKFAGKPIDKDRFEEEMVDDDNIRICYSQGSADVDENAPF